MPPQVMSPKVMMQRRRETTDQQFERLVRRADRTIDQCRRFEEHARAIGAWATRWPTDAFGRWLDIDGLDHTTREIAVVALALRATAAAGDILQNYDATPFGEDHELFCDVACFEWRQRHKKPSEDRKYSRWK